MFPMNDFNFVFCGIATVAATVGYAFTRKQEPELSSPFSSENTFSGHSSSSMIEKLSSGQEPVVRTKPSSTSPAARRDSLKRKVPHDGFDEPTPDLGYPFNLNNIYPNKRSKTPPSKSDVQVDVISDSLSVQATSPPVLEQDVEIPPASEEANIVEKIETVPAIGTMSTVVDTPAPEPPRTPSPALAPNESTEPEASHVVKAPVTPAPLTRVSTMPVAFTPTFGSSTMSASKGFAAFAGSTSPFASVTKVGSHSSSTFRTSLWSLDGDALGSQNGPLSSDNALSPAFGESATEESQDKNTTKHAIDAATLSKPQTKFTHVTGEESEDVEQELKGVKLFVKRGNKPFASGMVGHLKLLSDRETLAERLLFRRDPLWQVSMNVKVNATVRCTYEPEENAIRLVLKEPVVREAFSSIPKGNPLELVVYALKPGRACSKQDFREFAESLLKNAQLQKPEDTTGNSMATASS